MPMTRFYPQPNSDSLLTTQATASELLFEGWSESEGYRNMSFLLYRNVGGVRTQLASLAVTSDDPNPYSGTFAGFVGGNLEMAIRDGYTNITRYWTVKRNCWCPGGLWKYTPSYQFNGIDTDYVSVGNFTGIGLNPNPYLELECYEVKDTMLFTPSSTTGALLLEQPGTYAIGRINDGWNWDEYFVSILTGDAASSMAANAPFVRSSDDTPPMQGIGTQPVPLAAANSTQYFAWSYIAQLTAPYSGVFSHLFALGYPAQTIELGGATTINDDIYFGADMPTSVAGRLPHKTYVRFPSYPYLIDDSGSVIGSTRRRQALILGGS